jgi:hypothetical protein
MMPEQNEKVQERNEQATAESGYPRSEQRASEPARSDEMRSDEMRSDEMRSDEMRSDEMRSDEMRSDEMRSEQTRTAQTPTVQTPTGQTPTGQTPTGQTPTGQTPTGQTPTGQQTAHPADGQRERLLPADHAASYGSRWDAVKGTFVDDPREAVAQADALVGELLDELENVFREQRRSIERSLDSDETSTEDLRLALRRYRSFFERLLAV